MVKVYALTPRWFLRPHNTDWVYTRLMLPRLSEFTPGCTVCPAKSLATTLRSNARYVSRRLQERFGLPVRDFFQTTVDRTDFARSNCDVLFSHDGYPAKAAELPVIWQNSILDPEMSLAWGPSTSIAEEREAKGKCFAQAARVLVSTHAEKQRLSRWFPALAHKFTAVPFFLPYVAAIPAFELQPKLDRHGTLRCLFVGHEAYRKGLDRVLAALLAVEANQRSRIQLTVISRRTDRLVPIPHSAQFTHIRSLSREAVLHCMREADVVLMPSRYESYGITFVEAMSQGAIPVAPDWEVQREIVDYGRAGLLTCGEPTDIAAILEELLDDPQRRRRLAWAARQRFVRCYAPEKVARQLSFVFHQAACINPDQNLPLSTPQKA